MSSNIFDKPIFRKELIEVEIPYCPDCRYKMVYFNPTVALKPRYECSNKKCKTIFFVDRLTRQNVIPVNF